MRITRWARAAVAAALLALPMAALGTPSPALAADHAADVAVPVASGTHQGLTYEGRSYDLFIPDATPRAFVLALHNYRHTPRTLEDVSQIFTSAAAHDWVVVVPAGIERSWNAGVCCGYASAHGLLDEQRLSDLDDHVADALGITGLPRFAVGLSNGGMMAARMSCDRVGGFTAVVLVSANLEEDGCEAFAAQVLVVRGGHDRSVPIGGARYNAHLKTRLHSDGYLLGTWRGLRGSCRQTTTSTRAVVQHVLRCGDGGCLRYVEDRTGGHVWFAHRRHDAVDTDTLLGTFIDEHAPATD